MKHAATALLRRAPGTVTCPRLQRFLQQHHPLEPALESLLGQDQQRMTAAAAVERWLQGLLLPPNEDFAALLTPWIDQRFREYLTQLRGTRL